MHSLPDKFFLVAAWLQPHLMLKHVPSLHPIPPSMKQEKLSKY